MTGCGVSRVCEYPKNTTRSSDVVLMLGQRRRRWPNVKTTLDQRLVFAGQGHIMGQVYSPPGQVVLYILSAHIDIAQETNSRANRCRLLHALYLQHFLSASALLHKFDCGRDRLFAN